MLEGLQNQTLSYEQLEEKKQLLLDMATHARDSGLTHDAPFEVKQQILKLFIDRIVLNVNEGWFRIEGIILQKHHFGGEIASDPEGKDSSQMS